MKPFKKLFISSNIVNQISIQSQNKSWKIGIFCSPLCTFEWEKKTGFSEGKNYLYSATARRYPSSETSSARGYSTSETSSARGYSTSETSSARGYSTSETSSARGYSTSETSSARGYSTSTRYLTSTRGYLANTRGYSTSARDENETYGSAGSINDSISTEESKIAVNKKIVIPKHCPGCGAVFQNSSKLKAGYLPPINLQDRQLDSFLTDDEIARIARIEKSNEPITPKDVKLLMKKRNLSKVNTAIVCWKCHSSGHQNLLQNQLRGPAMLKTNRTQFSNLKIKSGGLLILMLDMMDLPNSIIEDLTDYTGQKDLIVLLSKADIMPPTLNWSRVNAFLKRYPLIKDAKAIIPISANSGQGMDLVAKYLMKYFQKGNDIYLVGCTNAGKSSFMNYWKKKIGHEIMITTSITSGTTAGLLKLASHELWPALFDVMENDNENSQVSQLPPPTNLIDTAGIVKEDQLYHFLNAKQLKYLAPTKRLVEHSLEFRPNTSYWIGGLIRLDVHHFQLSTSSPTIRFHLVPKLKVFPSKLGKKPSLHKENAVYLQKLPPILSCASTNTEDTIDLQLATKVEQKNKKEMIWISGVGWITFSHDSPKFTAEVYSHLGKGISISRALHLDS